MVFMYGHYVEIVTHVESCSFLPCRCSEERSFSNIRNELMVPKCLDPFVKSERNALEALIK